MKLEQCHYYNYAGLEVTSELEIPEWSVYEHFTPHTQTDIQISLEEKIESDFSEEQETPVITFKEYKFFVPTIGSYHVEEGNKITVTPMDGANPQAIRLYLLGSAIGALYYQRGDLALHMSVVQVGETCVAFCGNSGRGKSTLVAYLVRDGFKLVCDDLCRLDISRKNEIKVWPSTPGFKLWQDTVNGLKWTQEKMERDHYRYDKYHLPLRKKEKFQRNKLPLKAIYLLEWGKLNLNKLTGLTALNQFISAATYRHGLIEPMGLTTSYWKQCIRVIHKVPVWKLQRSRNLMTMNLVIDFLKSHWIELEILNTTERTAI